MPSIIPLPQGFNNPVCVPIPRVWEGDQDIPVGRVWLSFACDTQPVSGYTKVGLRIALYQKGRGWRIINTVIDSTEDANLVDPWDGESKVSVMRTQVDANDKGDAPAGFMVEAVLSQ